MPNGALGNKKIRIRTGAFHESNLSIICELVYRCHPPPKMSSQESDVNVRVPLYEKGWLTHVTALVSMMDLEFKMSGRKGFWPGSWEFSERLYVSMNNLVAASI
jgi:hypothetical protein